MYMLDTNICIFLINNKSRKLIEKIVSIPIGYIFISTITVAELEYGIAKSIYIEKNRQALSMFLSTVNVVDFDIWASHEFGIIRSDLEKRGKVIASFDMLIAGHARSRGYILVTNNTKEFNLVNNLIVEDWS